MLMYRLSCQSGRTHVLLKGFEEGTGKPIIEKAKNRITLKRLLTYSTGLSYVPLDPRLQQ
jgi:CubicO group peptidase (beta-lactamase class C family)